MISKILLATHNQHKVAEIEAMLADLPFAFLSLADFPDSGLITERGTTFKENAVQKAKAAAAFSAYPTLAEDSGLIVDALDGQPGIYSARFAGENASAAENNAKLLRLLQGVPVQQRTARFLSVCALVLPEGQVYTTEGQCLGLIGEELRGKAGFGYDPLFYVPELGKTLAEVSQAEKNKISHRGKAWRQMVPLLQKLVK